MSTRSGSSPIASLNTMQKIELNRVIRFRDLKASFKGVSDNKLAHSVPLFGFSASLYMKSSYALGDALLGWRNWTDPEMVCQRDILLGPDDQAAWEPVNKVRSKMFTIFLH